MRGLYTKGIHYSPGMESSVLGACIVEKTAFGRIAGILSPEVFYYDAHKKFFECLKKMWDNSMLIDYESALLFINRSLGVTEIEGKNIGWWIIECTRDVVNANHLEQHALSLRQLYVERELMRITHGGLSLEGDVSAQVSKLQQELNRLMLAKTPDDWCDMSEVLVQLSKHMDEVADKEMVGVPTGFPSLDKMTGGFRPTQLNIVAARPSVGKSAILGKMAMAAAKSGRQVGIISLEMNNVQIGGRLVSMESGVEFWRIDRGRLHDENQRNHLYSAITKMAHLPIRISDKTQVNISDIKAKAIQLIHKDKLDILFIDYLQLMEAENKNGNRDQEIGKISRGLKIMAMEYGIPIIALCQLNRQSETRTDKRPRLSDMRESGNIEQDADGVLLVHRDWMAGILQDENGHSTERQANLIIAKWRNGELGDIPLNFDGERMWFYEDGEVPRSGISSSNYYEAKENPF